MSHVGQVVGGEDHAALGPGSSARPKSTRSRISDPDGRRQDDLGEVPPGLRVAAVGRYPGAGACHSCGRLRLVIVASLPARVLRAVEARSDHETRSSAQRRAAWSMVIPVKVLAQAKSRLAGLAGTTAGAAGPGHGGRHRGGRAGRRAGGRASSWSPMTTGRGRRAGRPGRRRHRRRARRPGLNAALVFGAAYAGPVAGPRPGGHGGRPARAAARRSWPCAGRGGRGRRGVRARRGRDRDDAVRGRARARRSRPAFGLGSRDRHRAAGAAKELDLPALRGLRQDVDTPADLRLAADLGLGPRTAAALDRATRTSTGVRCARSGRSASG